MTCPGCHAEVPVAAKFCPICGARLSRVCPSCGATAEAGHHFCPECGTALGDTDTPGQRPVPATVPVRSAPSAPVAERRLVSVLFADLVGFTPLAEERDPEEVRDLLTRYFDVSRTVIGRHGGVIEKFIGDAVMAVWGTPTAREDDAERAVRAALELVDAVTELGATTGIAELRLRGGVATGEAAITVAAQGQGMVAGDIVNTASRIQAAAPSGGVLVDDATRRITDTPIAYEDAGARQLKGKLEPVQLWRATRVVAMVGGARSGSGLEAPFVGRDREMRLVKELFHSSTGEGRARLVSVTGQAGIGKSRLAWEFEKYVDGIADVVLWHRGRCLSYGDGVTYWALAEMVRRRADIAEGETPETATGKLVAMLEHHVTDGEERSWLEPRLSHLLGLEELNSPDPADLFAAWRLFFERLAERSPLVLLFEDMQWADAGLVEFIEYLLDWSRRHPLFVVTLARPEFAERHATWGSGKRNFTSIYLEPLSAEAMDELLVGLVPGLPPTVRDRIRDRAEGVPLYAVETVRMLLDRGRLRREGNSYVLTDVSADLEVPDTLHALVAARLDGLAARERALLQDAAVLGQSFTKERLASLAGMAETEIATILDSLVRKELLSVQSDPRSPERGQYGFLQALVQRVAYETLTRRDRKGRHLDAARQLEASWFRDGDEVVEVLASHYLEAYEAAPADPDAPEIRDSARRMLTRAGSRAASLAANREAERYFLRATGLADDAIERAELLERAGEVAALCGHAEAAKEHYGGAIALFEAEGHSHPAARVSARLGEIEWNQGRLDDAVTRLEAALGVLATDEPDGAVGAVAAMLARIRYFRGEADRAGEVIETALDIAEALGDPELLSQSLNTKALVVKARGHSEEGVALLTHALKVALDNDLTAAAARAYTNLSVCRYDLDDFEGALTHSQSARALARKRGDRGGERFQLANIVGELYLMGRWDEALECAAELSELDVASTYSDAALSVFLPALYVHRGELADARRIMELSVPLERSTDVQTRSLADVSRARLLLVDGRFAEAAEVALGALEGGLAMGGASESAREGFALAVDAAFAADDLDRVDGLIARVDGLRPADSPGQLRAYAARARAQLAAARGEHDFVAMHFDSAEETFRRILVPFDLAVTLLHRAEWLCDLHRIDETEPLLDEAAGIFAALKAAPWAERVESVRRRGIAVTAHASPTPA